MKIDGYTIEEGRAALIEKYSGIIDQQAKRISELESALIEERACGLFNGPWCSDLPDDCGYDAEMNAARIEARQQLRSEGKL